VIVISLATFGSATKVPAPRRRSRYPSRTSSSSAARTVRRETPRSPASCRSDGIESPTSRLSIRSSTRSRVSRCFVIRRRVQLGAERLAHLDLDLDRGQAGPREGNVLEALRPDAEDDAVFGRRRLERHLELREGDGVALAARVDEVHRRRADERRDEEVVRLLV